MEVSAAIRRSLAGVVLTCFFMGAAGQTNGDVILRRNGVNSRSYSSGRLLIYTNALGRFGSVKNDDYFDLKAATVVCQQLQFDGAYGFSDASHDSFGNDFQPLVLQQVICDSDRYLHIFECDSQSTYLPSYHYLDDVSVFCRSVPIWDSLFMGQVRLQGGDFPSEGRVEIYCNGEWGTICAGGFEEDDARVVCQQLGYSDQQQINSLTTLSSPSTMMPVWMERPGCTTSSWNSHCLSSCWQCPVVAAGGCPSSQGDASVSCEFDSDSVVTVKREDCDSDSGQYSSYPSNGDVVRAEADVFNQSLLIYYHERWNFLCGDSFSQEEADVACHQMGYPGGATTFSRTAYGDVADITPMGVVRVDCSSSPDEDHLLRCHVTYGLSSCQKLVFLSCTANDLYTPYEGEVRLVEGLYPSEGRVDIFFNGQWGTVCDTYVDSPTADVMCRQLGYTNSISFSNHFPGDEDEPIWAHSLDCSHEEICFSNCLSYVPETSHTDCSHSQDTFIKCNYSIDYYGAGSQDECEVQSSANATPTPDSSSTSFGVVELAASIIGSFVFLLLLITSAVIIATCVLRSRRSSQAYRHLQQEETGMRDVVADDESIPAADHTTRRRNGLMANSNLPSLQFSYALVVPPEEDYSPSFDDPIPDEPPPPYTPSEDSQTLTATQTARSLPQDNQTSADSTVHENSGPEVES